MAPSETCIAVSEGGEVQSLFILKMNSRAFA